MVVKSFLVILMVSSVTMVEKPVFLPLIAPFLLLVSFVFCCLVIFEVCVNCSYKKYSVKNPFVFVWVLCLYVMGLMKCLRKRGNGFWCLWIYDLWWQSCWWSLERCVEHQWVWDVSCQLKIWMHWYRSLPMRILPISLRNMIEQELLHLPRLSRLELSFLCLNPPKKFLQLLPLPPQLVLILLHLQNHLTLQLLPSVPGAQPHLLPIGTSIISPGQPWNTLILFAIRKLLESLLNMPTVALQEILAIYT